MTNEEILAAFVKPQSFPEAAIVLASERRAEIAPHLLAEIEDCAAGRREHITGYYYLPDIACHLLADWRDTRAFKPMLSLLNTPYSEILGDSITESVPALLARTYDGGSEELKALIRNPGLGEFVREAGLRAYVMLVHDGRISRDDLHAFLLDFYEHTPHETNYIWSGWIYAVAHLQFEDLLEHCKRLFDADAVDITWIEYDEFIDMYEQCRRQPYRPDELAYDDPIGDMRRWQYGLEDEEPTDLDDDMMDALAFAARDSMTVINEYRNVGRNDPCPCGSGKKFKKCCLRDVELL